MGPNPAESDGAIPAVDLPSCEGCRRRKLKCTRQRPLCSNCERLEIDCIYENRRNKPGLKGGAVESLNRRLVTSPRPWIPLLQEAGFRKRLLTSDKTSVSVILHAMLVAASRFIERRDHEPSELKSQVQRSRNLVIATSMNALNVESLQALAIVAFSDIGNGERDKAWPIIGSISRSVQYLQLSYEDEDRQRRSSFIRPSPHLTGPRNWVEEEERRRVFWNIFILDRFCSMTTGCNASLTAVDVCRRLPVCGGRWYAETPAVTPYLGIWDRSSAKIGNSITFLPTHHSSPSQSNTVDAQAVTNLARPETRGAVAWAPVDMSSIGAFAYYIESIESLSRINTYFLQEKVNFSDRKEVSDWLTRFKELDLRLVHWKMFLPQQWKDSGISRREMPGVMDPNMTLAHITHNTSMILLHQRIAYPAHELRGIKLPSSYSAETCLGAAVENANMVRKYLAGSPVETIVSPHMSFCCFISAKILLVHWRRYDGGLSSSFWALIDSLEEMSRRWSGDFGSAGSDGSSLFSQFATRLRKLHDLCESNTYFRLALLEYADEIINEDILAQAPTKQADKPSQIAGHISQSSVTPVMCDTSSVESTGDELSAISRVLMDEGFAEMDRIMSYDDIMFNTRLEDFDAGSSDMWLIQESDSGDQTGL
ncbi:Asperfuranone cluster transcription factor afoA [Colletotrichum fructicola Nara gc5]|uniref:Asperfuranone cluster transcription factor afoA n=1 Tax=Colletotrichum fructicola (strain Nara gc5) TaxID=1213859 RepID=A0A7J6J4A7_COLFN|nr:Asperfuranone cluster transcription factor afoA [Colletotrichum fructicola Nara gc5]